MKESKLKGLLVIDLPVFEDERGFFKEVFRLKELEQAAGRPVNFVQVNHSVSKQKVLRGIHVATYDKLIYGIKGEILAVIVDLRPNSPTFKQFEMIELGDKNPVAVFVPSGFGNSYYVKSSEAHYIYLVTEYYDPTKEKAVSWDDPDLNIPWPDRQPLISDRDKSGGKLSEF